MRVALLSPLSESVPPRLYGGTERVIFNLCKGLAQAGHEVTLFASGDSVTDCELVPIVPEALRLSTTPCAEPSAHELRMLAMVADRAAEFDLVHNHHDYWMMPLSRMTGVPLLTTLHGRLDNPEAALVYACYPGVSLVSISDAQRAQLPELRWLRTIHHGIDTAEFAFRDRPGSYLAFLGRISAEKGPDQACLIARLSGVPLKIAAKIEGPKDTEYFERKVKPYIDGKLVEFVGEISEKEKSEFLGGALAMAFPIDWPEPFGLVMLESLACGTPVLARPCGAAPEILEDGVTGFLHSDVRELARRVRDVAALDRARCRRRVEERFSLRRMTEDYIHAYRHLVEFAPARSDRHRRDLLHPVKRTADRNR